MKFLKMSGGDCGPVAAANALKLLGYKNYKGKPINYKTLKSIGKALNFSKDYGTDPMDVLDFISDAAWSKKYTIEQIYGSMPIDIVTRTIKRGGFCVLSVCFPGDDCGHIFIVKGYNVVKGKVTFDTLCMFEEGSALDNKAIPLDDLRWVMKKTPRKDARLFSYWR